MQILAVVVRYKTTLQDSLTVQAFCKAFAADPELATTYKLLIWDNSPEPLVDPKLSIPFTYRHSGSNLGVSGAYNGALPFAEEQGQPWMLLLDQDSSIDVAFLRSMHRNAAMVHPMEECAAIAPTVKVGNVVVSPKQQLSNRNRDYAAGESGIAEGEAIAINSGCLMRVSSLREIGGFSTDFWLDFSDIYVFRQFYLAGKKVWKAGDTTFKHDMTMMDFDRLMTPWRYRNYSYAETAFYDLYRSRLENVMHTCRLFARVIKQYFKYKNPEFYRIAWEQLLYRLRKPSAERIRQWKFEGEQRGGSLSGQSGAMKASQRGLGG